MIHRPRHAIPLILVTFLTATLAVACGKGGDSSGAPAKGVATAGGAVTDPAADEAAIRKVLDQWYVAMQAADSAGTVAPLTRDFLLLEDTLPLTGPQLASRLKGEAETKWAASFSDFNTRFNGNVAWTTLRNHETSTGKDGKACQADFIETIVFVREGERWLIDRYHAAALHRWSYS